MSKTMTAKIKPLFDYLDALTGQADQQKLGTVLEELDISVEDLAEFVHFDDGHYARNLLRGGQHYHALLLCWRSGHRTPIHNHPDAVGGHQQDLGAEVVDIAHFPPPNGVGIDVRLCDNFPRIKHHIVSPSVVGRFLSTTPVAARREPRPPGMRGSTKARRFFHGRAFSTMVWQKGLRDDSTRHSLIAIMSPWSVVFRVRWTSHDCLRRIHQREEREAGRPGGCLSGRDG
ncbi:MAG: hypothetical protein IID37_15820 [Planctomycetes bacterium]|nr:hypothetical protein [Planctomycetota bacterium]